MKLKTQVIIISLFQALVDIAGIITAVYFNKIVNSLENTRTNEPSNIVSNQQLLHNYSYVENVNVLYYTLPYIFSGVIPRMLNGFECLTADQLVSKHLKEWRQVEKIKEDSKTRTQNFPILPEYWDSVLNETENNLIESIDRRKQKCTNSNYKISQLRIDDNMNEKQFLEDFAIRRNEDKNTSSVYLMCWFELATMAANSLSSVLIATLAIFNLELPLLHIPWLLLTAIEITGNICVSLAFSVVPGYCLLTSAICVTRALWLGTIWSKTIRRFMISALPISSGFDLERETLRSQLSYKGKLRLSRFFWSLLVKDIFFVL